MARHQDREKAIELRKTGLSYSQIKSELGISKSTLHYWLTDYPLSEERVRALRDWSAQRIEHSRETSKRKREARREAIRTKSAEQIGKLTKRECLMAGFFLYWAEGMKVDRGTVQLTNTDPAMLRFFVRWMALLGISKEKLKARLHLYSDMDIPKQIEFWSEELYLPISVFRNTYVKQSESSKRKNYKGRFGFGTCSLWVCNRLLYERIITSIDVLRSASNIGKK